MSRYFTPRQKYALFVAANGRCSSCGSKLRDGWHADHSIPFSFGGDTDVVNGQAMCPACNMRKGSSVKSPLRKWQIEALRVFVGHKSNRFLLEACPAAGKTRFYAEAAKSKLTEGEATRIIVVVPIVTLKRQTAKAFQEAGLSLHFAYENPSQYSMYDSPFPTGAFEGMVVTYAQVAKRPDLYRKFSSERSTLVILDEIHHGNEQETWGRSLQTSFDSARFVLSGSGTPFRIDGRAIPFINYGENDRAVPDFRIGYGEALLDDIVRPVYFPRFDGTMEWKEKDVDEMQKASFDDDLDDKGQSRRLQTALTVMEPTSHLSGLMSAAHRQIIDIRKTDTNAGALVVGMDQRHVLRIVKEIMKQQLRLRPEVAISDMDLLSGNFDVSDRQTGQDVVDRFRSSEEPWIAAVRMITEGVDVPRLRVGVYGTNYTSELFFRQWVGRYLRKEEEGDVDQCSFCFIPADPRLVKYALEIKNTREAILKERRESKKPDGPVERIVSDWTAHSSTSEAVGTIAGEFDVSPSEVAKAEAIRKRHPELTGITSTRVALIWKLRESEPFVEPQNGDAVEAELGTDKLKRLKKKIRKRAAAIGRKYDLEFDKVHGELNQFGRIGTMTTCYDLEVLERMLDAAENWYLTGRSPNA